MDSFWGFAPIAISLAVALFFLTVLVLQWLWNITMPDVFNLKCISYWQSFRLLLIAGILFSGKFIALSH